HTANVLVTPDDKLYVVDWDQPVLAPKERDLMFVIGDSHEDLYFQGYGETDVERLALAFYFYARAVEDLGAFAERVFLAKDASEETKLDSARWFRKMFARGQVVQAAHSAIRDLTI